MGQGAWIEVAVNGAWTRKVQPNIPITAEEVTKEGVACIKAGAAIVHAHTVDPDTGKQNSSPDRSLRQNTKKCAEVAAQGYEGFRLQWGEYSSGGADPNIPINLTVPRAMLA